MGCEQDINNWKIHTIAGNDSFDKHQLLSALAHYRRAINQAESLFSEREYTQDAVSMFVVSYQNVADLYIREGQPDLAEAELTEVHHKLVNAVKQYPPDSVDLTSLLWGVNRTYFALINHRAKYPSSKSLPAMPNLFESTYRNTLS